MLLVVTEGAGGKPSKTLRKPILTTDIFSSTAELMYDIYADAWKGLAEPLLATFDIETKVKNVIAIATTEGDKLLGVACEKAGLKKKEVYDKIEVVKGSAMHAKAIGYEFGAKAYEPMRLASEVVVTR